MRLFADHLILYKNYNNHPSDDTVITKFWNYDIKKNKIIKSQNFYFSYPSYTHLVGNFIDISGNNIAFSQTIPYHIDILSPGFDIKDRIVGAPFKNDEYFLEKIDSLHQVLYKSVGIKEVLYALRKQDSIKRIEKVIFLDSVTLLVSKTIPKGGWEKRSLDVWQLKRGHWVQVVFDQLYETEKKGDYFLTSETIPLDLTFSNKLIIVKGHVYLVNPKIGPATGINKSDYDKSMNEYYEHNSLNYFLWDFKWEIN